MPTRAPSLRSCGCVVSSGERCPHMIASDRDRKARHDAARPSARQRGYSSKWESARAAYLAKHPACARCGGKASVVDHRKPHKGDSALFWDSRNWQPLCTHCHSSPKQADDRREAAR